MVVEQFIMPPGSIFEARKELSKLGHANAAPDMLVSLALRTISAALEANDKAAGFNLLWAVASTGEPAAAKALADAIDGYLAETALPDAEVKFYEGVAQNWRDLAVQPFDFSRMAAMGKRKRVQDDALRAGTTAEPGRIVLHQIGDMDSSDGRQLAARVAPIVGRHLKRAGISPAEGAVMEAVTTDWPWARAAAKAVELSLDNIRLTGSKRGLNQPILFVGPPGCGKTSIARAIAALLGRHSILLPAAGTHDAGSLAAVARGWAGSRPSLPVMAMLESLSCDPCVIVDELDKASDIGSQNGSVVGTLLGMLNGTGFFDTALLSSVDLSDVLFIGTANDVSQVSKALLDRFDVISVDSPDESHMPIILRKLKRDKASFLEVDPFLMPDLDEIEQEVLKGFFSRSGRSLRAVSRAYDRVLNAALKRERMQMRM
jgi:energy-coupling factor transporter ATP-binding protein EcfA2